MERIKIRKNQFRIKFNCDYCHKLNTERESHYKLKMKHFCNQLCYSDYRRNFMSKEDQNAYRGGGMSEDEKKIRIKARSDLNHAIRDGKIKRLPCFICGDLKSEAHHRDYTRPLEVDFLCDYHHHIHHSSINRNYENPELKEPKNDHK